MSKKNLIFIMIVVIVVLSALLLWFYLFREPKKSPSLPDKTEISTTNPASELAYVAKDREESWEEVDLIVSEDDATFELPELQKLINTEVVGASLDNQGSRLQYYDALEGNLLSVTFLGTEPINLASPPDFLDEIIWSPDRKKLLFRSGDTGYQYADSDLQNPVDLGNHIRYPVFTDDSQLIIYQYVDVQNGLSNISLGRPKEKMVDFSVLAKMRGDVFIKRIPGQNKVAFYLKPRIDRESAIETVDISSGLKEIIVKQGLITDATFNPQGTKMVFTQLDDRGNLQLYLSDTNGKNIKQLPQTTYIEKLVWDGTSQFIYLAVPKLLPPPSDFYKKDSVNSVTDDIIYRYDVSTGEMTPVWNLSHNPNNKIVARDLFLAPEGKLLFFTNTVDQSLYVLNLMKT